MLKLQPSKSNYRKFSTRLNNYREESSHEVEQKTGLMLSVRPIFLKGRVNNGKVNEKREKGFDGVP